MKAKRIAAVLFLAWWVCGSADPVLATQTHGHPEGIYTHQMGHLFFLIAMGFLIYWLRERGLVARAGWRYIQYAGFFFILWNIDAFLTHLIDEQVEAVEIIRLEPWKMHISAAGGSSFLPVFYYIAKLDHLLSVPAMLFLYMGLKRLLKDSAMETSGTTRQ